VPLVVMGGWVRPMDADLPAYGPADDWNVAWDIAAARTVLESAGDLTLVTLADTLRTHVRAVHLPRLRSAGPLGELLARQAVAYAELRDHAALARAHEGLPPDLLHFLHDPLACAVALGWSGVRTDRLRLRPQQAGDGALSMVPDPGGRAVRVVTAVDGPAFAERWLQAVESLGDGSVRSTPRG
jgi:purine nucleosidase